MVGCTTVTTTATLITALHLTMRVGTDPSQEVMFQSRNQEKDLESHDHE